MMTNRNASTAHIRCYGTHVLDTRYRQLGDGIVPTLCKYFWDLSWQIVHRRTDCLTEIVNPAAWRTTFSWCTATQLDMAHLLLLIILYYYVILYAQIWVTLYEKTISCIYRWGSHDWSAVTFKGYFEPHRFYFHPNVRYNKDVQTYANRALQAIHDRTTGGKRIQYRVVHKNVPNLLHCHFAHAKWRINSFFSSAVLCLLSLTCKSLWYHKWSHEFIVINANSPGILDM